MFTDEEMRTLEAAVNRIIPPDDWPGGWAAGVGDYILGQLQGDLAGLVEQYRQGLDALEAEAMTGQGKGFAQLDPAQQDALLAQVERGATNIDWSIDAAAFFATLVQHCGEGYYADPGNGGNRDAVAWDMIGFELRDD
jgi:hypothetical protein